jgi:hypothetical protein
MGKVKSLIVAVVALLPLVAVVACNSVVPALQTSVDTAKKVKVEADAGVEVIKAEIGKLPAGDPVRVKLEEKIRLYQDVAAKADSYIRNTEGVIASLQSGTLDPNTAQVVGLLPYGSYAVAGLSVILAIMQRARANGALSDLSKVVESWDRVGPELSEADKRMAAAVQGAGTTARVHRIKKAQALARMGEIEQALARPVPQL